MLVEHPPIIIPNHNVRITSPCGENVGVPSSRIVVFAMAILPGDHVIELAENAESIDRHGPRSLSGAAPQRSMLSFL
jgi:hypothetical protein